MFNAMPTWVGLLCLAAVPALAQPTITTQTPPAPNAQSFTPQPSVSVPAGAATATAPRPGDDVATTPTTPVPVQPGTAPSGGATGMGQAAPATR